MDSATLTELSQSEKTSIDIENNMADSKEEKTFERTTTSPVPTSTSSPETRPPVKLEVGERPTDIPALRKWIAVLVISSSALCVTCNSSIAAFAETGVAADLHVSHEVTILSISLFVIGLGIGPLLVGPLSETYGRNPVYKLSFFFFFVFTWPVAFAKSIAVHLIFRFITGFSGSAFLAVAGGSVSDMFDDATVAGPMAVYTLSPFIGPEMGPLIGGFINQHLDWRWTYRIMLIWIFVQWILLMTVVPETYCPVLLKQKAKKLRQATGHEEIVSPLELEEKSLIHAILTSCKTPFQLIIYERMALLLNLWTSMVLGILYLAFQAFPIIFGKGHHFNLQTVGLSFLGIGFGLLLGLSTQPFWNKFYRRKAKENGGVSPPENLLIMGQVGGICVPIGLYWLAFTSYPHVHWIVPIIASIPFGSGIYFVFTSTFTYLVTTYRPVAASVMASNSFMRSTFAAVFPLFAGAMYNRLGTVGATALLAGLMTVMVPLPFIFFRIGARLREKSRFSSAAMRRKSEGV